MNENFNCTLAGQVRDIRPLIHCITNYVTANDVANVILACGGSPIMADSPEEVEEVTAISNCLLLNMGTPNETGKASMVKAGREANRLNLPVIFDPVGAGASHYRTQMALSILKEVKLTVIRGNASELRVLLNAFTNGGAPLKDLKSRGVDAAPSDAITETSQNSLLETARALSAMTGAVTVMTGSTDIISTWNETWFVKNGCSHMAHITGSGCMLDGIIAAYVAAAFKTSSSKVPQHALLEAAALATAAAGLCGERAAKKNSDCHGGTGSFRCYFIDEISHLDENILKGGVNIEIS